MQSGLHRKAYLSHTRQITGIVCDTTNTMMVSGSLDETIKFWDFNTHKLIHTEELGTAIEQMVIGHESGLLAVCCADFTIRIIDISTKKVVRIFKHPKKIINAVFSKNEKWIVSASGCTVRTFDLSTSHLIDAFNTPQQLTSVTFSPTSNFVATTHVGNLGIYLWANRSQYEAVNIRQMQESEIRDIEMPIPFHSTELEIDHAFNVPVLEITDHVKIIEGLINLCSLPKSRWQNLLNLETIKVSRWFNILETKSTN